MRRFKIKEKDYVNVIDYFNNNNDNKTSTIAKKLNLKLEYTSYIIDVFLSKKANYMGTEIHISEHENKNGIAIEVYEDEKIIGSFKSIKDAGIALNICYGSIVKGLNYRKECTINHYVSGKQYTYIKI